MIITKATEKKGRANHTFYCICTDIRETGGPPEEIVRTESLSDAVMMLKYMRGDILDEVRQTVAETIICKLGF